MAPQEEGRVPGREDPPMSGSKKIIIAVVAIVIVIIVVAAFVLSTPKYQITSTNEAIVIAVHDPDGSVHNTYYNKTIKNSNGDRPLGSDLVFNVAFSNEYSNTLNITLIRSYTDGFSFKSCSPALPLTIPATPNQVTVTMTFSAPSTLYTGNFTFAVFMEQYPLG
jgi:hypothetical protein